MADVFRRRPQGQTSDTGRGKQFIPALGMALAGLLILPGCADTQKGDRVVATEHVCSSCHGMNGNSVSPTFPRLAGQQKVYIVTQLKAFRDHSRADPHAHTYMWGMAARLDDATIEGLASFYSSQPAVPGQPAASADVAAGKKIFEEGVAARDVPACSGCHGDQGQGGDAFPRLAGQHPEYIARQLAAFSSNARANEIMHQNSKNLNDEEMRQLAAYVSTL